MKKIANKKIVLLIVTILLLSARMLYLYSIRCSHFIDEFYSIGFANSKDLPFFIYPEIGVDGREYDKHVREWSSGKEIFDFITVSEDERFDFKNVINNKLQDTAPANFEIMVHFVCSLFPNTFSWAYPFSVNFVFFLGSLILVFCISYKTLKDCSFSFINAFVCMLFFSLSIAGTGAFTFLRMYGVLSFYGLLMIFCMQNLLQDLSIKSKILYGFFLYISVFLGLFTQPLFVVFAFFLTLYVCLYVLGTKKIIKSIKIGGIVLLSLISFVLVYPFDYRRIGLWMGRENHNGYSFWTRLIYGNMHMFGESLGFYIPFTYANILTWCGYIFLVVFIILCFGFLFRNEKWFIKIRTKLSKIFRDIFCVIKKTISNISPINYVMLLTSISYMLVVTAITPVATQHYVARYFMLGMFPLIISFVSCFNSLWNMVPAGKRLFARTSVFVFLAILLYVQNFVFGNPFYFNKPYDDEEILHRLTQNEDVMIFGSEEICLYSLMVPLRDVNSFYFGLYTDDLTEISEYPDNDFYIAVRSDCFEDESSRATLIDGLLIPGNTEEFAGEVLLNMKKNYSLTRVEDFYSSYGDYAIYYVSLVN